jgi:hypothetical protein
LRQWWLAERTWSSWPPRVWRALWQEGQGGRDLCCQHAVTALVYTLTIASGFCAGGAEILGGRRAPPALRWLIEVVPASQAQTHEESSGRRSAGPGSGQDLRTRPAVS